MRRFWLFRSNLIPLEYYHQYTDLESFEQNCHDYYLLLPLWLLQENYFDEVTIWRLTKKPKKAITFDVNGRKFIQKWVTNFKETFNWPPPHFSFFRGGFKEYDNLVKINPFFFGKKLYLGAGKRQFPQYGGIYNAFLMEDERDIRRDRNCFKFYKTASPYIFYPMDSEKKWDICWPCNFTQIRYKGQEFFIKTISENPYLQKLKIVHCGNKPEIGKKLAKKYNVKNIEFMGSVQRPTLNVMLNASKFGLNLSNIQDGCPRVSTEVLMSGTPLILRDSVRLLNYYKEEGQGVINVNDDNITGKIMRAMNDYDIHSKDVLNAINTTLSFEKTNEKNIKEWQKI